jgi:CDP-diacylglycerol pyrophosphatase
MLNYIKKNKILTIIIFIIIIVIIGGFFYSNSKKQRWDCLEKIVYADNVYIYDNFKDFKAQNEAIGYCLLENKYK